MTVAAGACAALALLSAGAVLLRTRQVRSALPVLVDLLLAAALLLLAADPGWLPVAVAGAVVAVRALLLAGSGTWSSPTWPPRSAWRRPAAVGRSGRRR